MKVLNIVRYLPIEGFPVENDITFKIYADLEDEYKVKSLFVMPLAHIPKWATYLKKSLVERHKIINNPYIDKKYGFEVDFFQAYFPFNFIKIPVKLATRIMLCQYAIYKKRLYELFRSYKPEIIHAHTVFDAFYAYDLYKKFSIQYIVTLRGEYSDFYESKIVKKILQNSKKIVTPSYDLFVNLNKQYNIKLVPHGLDEIWFSNNNKEYTNKKIRLITVARLLKMKNIQIVLNSLTHLKNRGYSINYAIIGEGPYKKNLQDLTNSLKLKNEVTFMGYKNQEEIRNIYKKYNIFIMLSYPETFGRVYFEAAAQGLLIIGVKGTGADGYFDRDEAFFISPTIDETTGILKRINNEIFINMTNKSRLKALNFRNKKIVNNYYTILNN